MYVNQSLLITYRYISTLYYINSLHPSLSSTKSTKSDFQKRDVPLNTGLLIFSRVILYFIKITKTVDGGAAECQKCPVGMKDEGYIVYAAIT